MSVPYVSEVIGWNAYLSEVENGFSTNEIFVKEAAFESTKEGQAKRAVTDVFHQAIYESLKRSVLFVRHGLRTVLKTPIRLIKATGKETLWWQKERASINAKLALYSFVQMISVPAKFLVALAALAISPFSGRNAEWLQDWSESWTENIDGRMSKLEALKEEGIVNAKTKDEYNAYKKWVQGKNALLCRGQEE